LKAQFETSHIIILEYRQNQELSAMPCSFLQGLISVGTVKRQLIVAVGSDEIHDPIDAILFLMLSRFIKSVI